MRAALAGVLHFSRMNFFKQAFSETVRRYHASKVLYTASTLSGGLPAECFELAEKDPALVVTVLRECLNCADAERSHAYLVLLEKLVDACSFHFHLAMAQDQALHDKLVRLAVTRAEGEEHRKVRRAVRLMLLEYSRMFLDPPELRALASLAAVVEKDTGRSLIRAIEVEKKKVSFVDPRPEDIILISSVRELVAQSSSPPRQEVATWSCHVCTYTNEIDCTRCDACKTVRPAKNLSPPPQVEGTADGAVASALEILEGTVWSEEQKPRGSSDTLEDT